MNIRHLYFSYYRKCDEFEVSNDTFSHSRPLTLSVSLLSYQILYSPVLPSSTLHDDEKETVVESLCLIFKCFGTFVKCQMETSIDTLTKPVS